MMYGVLLVTLALLQLGYSYYLSIASVGSALIIWANRKRILWSLGRAWAVRLFCVLFMISTPLGSTGADWADFARAAREAIVFVLIISLADISFQRCEFFMRGPGIRFMWKYLLTFSLFMLIFVLVQTLFLARGLYFGIPDGFFVQNAGALPTELALFYSSLRPSGSYGEPSYLGVVCITLIYGCLPALQRRENAKISIFVNFIVVLGSRTLLGIGGAVLIFICEVASKSRGNTKKVVALSIIILMGFGILLTENDISSRLYEIRMGEDASTLDRIGRPVLLLWDLMASNPVGTPMSIFIERGYITEVDAYSEYITHNGLANMFINYGYFGFIMLLLILYELKSLTKIVFVLIVSVQNGAFLAPDKLFLIGLGMMLYNSYASAAGCADTKHKTFNGPFI